MFQLDSNIPFQRKTISDYMRQGQQDQLALDEYESNKEYKKAQMQALKEESLYKRMKAEEIDADKIGERAFLKAAQGMPLSSQEEAALQYIDAKSPTAAFNPVTGVMEQKPSLLDRAGLGSNRRLTDKITAPSTSATSRPSPRQAATPRDEPELSEWDIEFENQLYEARGNPKLQQTIRENYAKAKINMDESESKAAGYADRMLNSDPIIDKTAAASMDPAQVAKSKIPLIGNYWVSDDYQSATQAQKDFLNAILRRESGAVISPSEFAEGTKQYFPLPGDSDEVLAQKKANREAATKGVARSAGPAYKPTKTLNSKIEKKSDPRTGEAPGKLVGTSGGKKVYQLPDGSHVMEQ